MVKKEGKWGVYNRDTVVIPTKYDQVVRMSELSDTIFKVRIDRPGIRFMDTLTNDLPLVVNTVMKSTEHFSIVRSNKRTVVLDNQYNPLSYEGKSYKLLGNDSFFEKEKDQFHIYNAKGEHIATATMKPFDILHNEVVVFKNGSKYGAINNYSDTVILPSFKDLESVGDYIIARGNEGNFLYDNDCNLIRNAKSADVLVDSISGNYALIKNEKTKVYSSSGEKIAKYKSFVPAIFLNNVLIQMKGTTKVFFLNELTVAFPKEITGIQEADGQGYLIESRDSTFYFDKEWNILNDGVPFVRALYYGQGFVGARVDSGMILFSPNTYRLFDNSVKFRSFSEGRMLLSVSTEKWFINTDLEDLFNRKFKNALPFKGNFAPVQVEEGWTIIDKNGFQKSFGSYDKITAEGNNIFSTRRNPLYGLFDSTGKEIIPVQYERITILRQGVIQTVKEGAIYYFDFNGNSIDY